MISPAEIYIYVMFFSGILSFILAWYSWQTFVIQQKMTPAKYFTILLSCVGVWAFGSGLALWFTDEGLTYFCEQWKYIGIVFIPPTWLLLTCSWTGKDSWVNKKTLILLYFLPLFFLIIVFTNHLHHLFWEKLIFVPYGPYINTDVVHGPVWWSMWGYLYILLIIGSLILIKNVLKLHNFYKKQTFILLLGLVIPWFANALYSFNLLSFLVGSFDITPVSFVFTGFTYIYGFNNFKLINIFPVPKETVFNNLKDPLVVCDAKKNIIDINISAIKVFSLDNKQIIGTSVFTVFSSFPKLVEAFKHTADQQSFEIRNDQDMLPKYYDVTLSRVKPRNQPHGYILLFRDITERKKMMNALIESERQFQSIFEGVNDALFLHDIKTGKIIKVNKKACDMFGYDKEELKGMTLGELTTDSQLYDDYMLVRSLDSIREGKIQNVQWHAKDKRHNNFWVEVNPSIISIDQNEFLLVSIRNIDDKKKAEIQLKESEEKFRIFTEASSLAIMIYQNDRWIYANPAAESLTGFRKKELLQMKFWEFVHQDYKDLIIKRGTARQQGKTVPSQYQFKIVTKNGREKWVDFRADEIEFRGKKAILVNASDITDKKESEKTIDKQLTAIKSSMDGVAILNKKGEYEYLNDTHVSVYGYDSAEELIGESWRKLYNEKELKRFDEEILPQVQQDGQWRGEAVGKKKDGTRFNQEITLTAIEDGLICVIRDITKQKMMIKELEDAHQLLFVINKDLKRKVKNRTEKIEKLIEQKDDFINQLGHDLKTPLTPMMVLLPLLKEKAQTDKDNELFEVIIRNVYFMKDLVNKTIDLAKLNTDKIEFSMQPLVLSDEIDEVLINNKTLFEENNIEVSSTVDPSVQIIGDKLRIQEVFNNLLTNAIKYTPHDGKGFISIHSEEDNPNEITVAVSDTGMGMNKEQQEKMFDEFYKADESRHNLDSSGLGLSITKKIVEKHHGRIWAESEGIGKGSTFYFTLKKVKTEKNRENISTS